MINAVVNSIPVTWASDFALSILLCLFCAGYLLFIVRPFGSELGLYDSSPRSSFQLLKSKGILVL